MSKRPSLNIVKNQESKHSQPDDK